eukprot:775640-Pelagomonas_calceolata.AAC.3
MFVEKGGLDLLLKLHTLPRLVYTFGFSASSHAMLTVFRSLAPHHAQVCACVCVYVRINGVLCVHGWVPVCGALFVAVQVSFPSSHLYLSLKKPDQTLRGRQLPYIAGHAPSRF